MEKTKLTREKYALVDKTSYYGFEVTKINYDLLCNYNLITSFNNSSTSISINGSRKFDYIKIKKRDFEVFARNTSITNFYFGRNKNGQLYGSMDISSGDGFSNLNCDTIPQKIAKLEEAKEILSKYFGIEISLSDIKYSSIEINTTFILSKELSEYTKIVNQITYNFPRYLRLRYLQTFSKDGKKRKIIDYNRKYETFTTTSGEKGIDIKIYDKRKELLNSRKLDEDDLNNYTRFEITLKSPKKIKDIFNTNYVYSITQEMIQEYFNDFIRKNIIDANVQFRKELNKYLQATINKYRDKHQYTKIISDIHINADDSNIYNILDINDILNMLGTLKPVLKEPELSKYKKGLTNSCKRNFPQYLRRTDLLKTEFLECLSCEMKSDIAA